MFQLNSIRKGRAVNYNIYQHFVAASRLHVSAISVSHHQAMVLQRKYSCCNIQYWWVGISSYSEEFLALVLTSSNGPRPKYKSQNSPPIVWIQPGIPHQALNSNTTFCTILHILITLIYSIHTSLPTQPVFPTLNNKTVPLDIAIRHTTMCPILTDT